MAFEELDDPPENLDANEFQNKLCQAEPIERILEISLEEALKGCTKNETILRKLVDHTSGRENEENKILSVEVKPGVLPGTRITFPHEGNQALGCSVGDVIFTVQYKPHANFQVVNGFDILYTATISKEESLNGCEMQIPSLESDPICLTIDDYIAHNSEESIGDKGLPAGPNFKHRGALIVRFKVKDFNSHHNEATASEDTFEQKIMVEESFNQHQGELFNILPEDAQTTYQDPPIEHDLEVSLEDIFYGAQKVITHFQTITDQDGNQQKVEKIAKIQIEKGLKSGEKIVLPKMGDVRPGVIAADFVYTIHVKPHKTFERNGDDLEYTAKITTHQYAKCELVEIPTLDNKPIMFNMKKLATLDDVKRFMQRGLPNFHNPKSYGDLVVKFQIEDDDAKGKTGLFNMKPKDPPQTHTLSIPLENFVKGCKKRVRIRRMVHDSVTNKAKLEQKVLEIDIPANSYVGKQFVFPNEGDQNKGRKPADIVFILTDKPHQSFVRNENNIEYRQTISKSEAKLGTTFIVPLLDGTEQQLQIKAIKPGMLKTLREEGLPDEQGKRGDLIVSFEIIDDKFKDPPIERKLELSLEEILHGVLKKFKIGQLVIDRSGIQTLKYSTIEIYSIPGVTTGTTYVFHRLGDHHQNRIPSDVIFRVCEKTHDDFTRQGVDLVHNVPAELLRLGNSIKIPTLQKRFLNLQVNNQILTEKIKIYPGWGLPVPGKNAKIRGALCVKFEGTSTKIPSDLSRSSSNSAKPLKPIVNAETKQPLKLTLEEMRNGTFREVPIFSNGEPAKMVQLNLKPGFIKGAEFLHRAKGIVTIFKIEEKEHDVFKREGLDIIYRKKISLKEALCGCQMEIPTLEKETISMKFTKTIIYPGFRKVCKGYGLPHYREQSKFENLIVEFEVDIFKKGVQHYSSKNKNVIKRILRSKETIAPKPVQRSENEKWECDRKNQLKISQEMQKYPEMHVLEYDLEQICQGGKQKLFSNNRKKEFKLPPGTLGMITLKDMKLYIKDKQHEIFNRINVNDLECTVKISLYDALMKNFRFTLPNVNKTLLGESFHNYNIDSASDLKNLFYENRGLPSLNDPNKRGNLFVKFDIVFPQQLTEDEKAFLASVL